jgi:BlaI family transcriptional regulator, penicillinase repressor
MTLPPPPAPTDSELDILAILWRGPATVRAVHNELAPRRGTGYTTTLKLMQLMVEKGLAERSEAGNAHVYHAAIAPATARKQVVPGLVSRLFAGSTRALVQHALEEGELDAGEVAELRRLLASYAKKPGVSP